MKRVLCVVLAAALACGLCGCAKSEESSAQTSDDHSSPQSHEESVIQSETESATDGEAVFDLDKAVKSITVFGQEVSLPCTINDFGESFSLKEENMATVGESTSCGLLYQGKSIGTATFEDYGGDLKSVSITSLSLGFIATDHGVTGELREKLYEQRGWYSGLIETEIAGLSFDSTVSDAEKIFGAPVKNEGDSVTFEAENDVAYMTVEFYCGSVNYIRVSLKGETENEH
ncbi:MAG: hypothetical protein K2J77_02420 [Oscillospiraceae bacterium]|nr:hypothetical protein [Oscillospiraceae bacterium]